MEKYSTIKLANKIQRYRKEIGWSQSELGRQSSVTSAAISMIEKGGRWPSLVVAKKLAVALHASIDELMGDEVESVKQFKAVVFAARFSILDKLTVEDKALIIIMAKRLLYGCESMEILDQVNEKIS